MESEPTKKRILVVDDDTSFLRMMQLLLSRRGYEIFPVSRVSDAKKRIAAGTDTCDLILLDLMMPDENGFDFLNWKSTQNESIRNIPVLVNTAKKLGPEESNFLAAHSDGILDKGINFTVNLEKKISEILKKIN